MPQLRAINKVFTALEQSEGAGVRVRRSIGSFQQRNLSPFLMLDYLNGGIRDGFPDHPHRGQETVSYILKGSMEHEDFAGNRGVLYAGDLQFMTAGRGIMDPEPALPSPHGEPNAGFQLWVDIPKHLKMCEPRYRDVRAKEIPIARLDDGKVLVKVISGESGNIDGVKDLVYTPAWYLDVGIQPCGKLVQLLLKECNAFSYIYEGCVDFVSHTGDLTKVERHGTVIYKLGRDAVSVQVAQDADRGARFLIIAAEILDQPIVLTAMHPDGSLENVI